MKSGDRAAYSGVQYHPVTCLNEGPLGEERRLGHSDCHGRRGYTASTKGRSVKSGDEGRMGCLGRIVPASTKGRSVKSGDHSDDDKNESSQPASTKGRSVKSGDICRPVVV